MQENIGIKWGFEVQKYRIIPGGEFPERHQFEVPGTRFSKEGDLWVPNSRLITGDNLIMDIAQQELIKIWRFISGSVRQIQKLAVGSGFVDPTRTDTTLETELAVKNIESWVDAALPPDSVNLSETKAVVVWLSLEANGVISEIGLKFDDDSLVTHALFKKLTITNATQANPVVITTSASHGLGTGDEVHIDDIVGMTEINNRNFQITVVDADEFSLDGEDGTGHTAYSSAGSAWLIVVKGTDEVVETRYVITVQS